MLNIQDKALHEKAHFPNDKATERKSGLKITDFTNGLQSEFFKKQAIFRGAEKRQKAMLWGQNCNRERLFMRQVTVRRCAKGR